MKNVMDLLSLKNKVALVTGGSRGIGKGIAIALAQAGANIAIMAKNAETGRKTLAEIEEYGVKGLFIPGNVVEKNDCDNCVAEVMMKFGQIDILVNNAGISSSAPAEDMTWDTWHNVINTNLNGTFLMCQAAGREMIKKRAGSIINISSMSGFIVNFPQTQANYNASKAAVNHLTKSLAYEWAKYNIRVNAIAPGYIDTDMTYRSLHDETMFNDKGKIWFERTPMNRAGQTYELGGLAVLLASDASTFTTGSIIIVDGGYTIF